MHIAVDFDGTIVDQQFPQIGEPVPHAFLWLKRFKKEGAKLILWTWRSGDKLQEAIDFCSSQGLEFDWVNENPEISKNSEKVFADVYIDDSAIGCPLTRHPQRGRYPMADWQVIGPAVMRRIVTGSKELQLNGSRGFSPFGIFRRFGRTPTSHNSAEY